MCNQEKCRVSGHRCSMHRDIKRHSSPLKKMRKEYNICIKSVSLKEFSALNQTPWGFNVSCSVYSEGLVNEWRHHGVTKSTKSSTLNYEIEKGASQPNLCGGRQVWSKTIRRESLNAQGLGPCPVGVRGFESHPPHQYCLARKTYMPKMPEFMCFLVKNREIGPP